jgi:hypothetical protein
VYSHEYVYKPTTYGYGGYYGSSWGDNYRDWHERYYNYGASNKNQANVCNSQAEIQKQAVAKTQTQQNDNQIEKFFDTENGDDERSWVDEIGEDFNEGYYPPLTEEMRDELYDVIYALLNDCPNASYDMIRSAILNTYPDLSDSDIYATYGEVKYDMKKYMSMC